jgi:1,4-alpha-glucan branching enzyme
MGSEFGQFIEWNYKQPLDWLLLGYEKHRQMQSFVRELNRFYLSSRPLWENDSDWNGFQWISCDDRDRSIVAFRRIDRKGREVIAVCNFCPVLREHYRLGLPRAGWYLPVLNTDDEQFGGFGFAAESVRAEKTPANDLPYSAEFRVPPMSVVFYVHKRTAPEK